MAYSFTRIRHARDLEKGGFYKICGTDGFGLPLNPQVFQVFSIKRGFAKQDYILGRIWWKDSFGTHTNQSIMYAAEVNLPENGWSDMYLEKIDYVQDGLITEGYHEIDQHKKLYKPKRERFIDDLVEYG